MIAKARGMNKDEATRAHNGQVAATEIVIALLDANIKQMETALQQHAEGSHNFCSVQFGIKSTELARAAVESVYHGLIERGPPR